MSVKVNITSHMSKFIGDQTKALDFAAVQMATDIHRQSAILTPKDKHNLVNSGRIERQGSGKYSVTYGDSSVRYARIHELGGITGRGYRTHITAKHYLQRPGDNVTRDVKRYLPKI